MKRKKHIHTKKEHEYIPPNLNYRAHNGSTHFCAQSHIYVFEQTNPTICLMMMKRIVFENEKKRFSKPKKSDNYPLHL